MAIEQLSSLKRAYDTQDFERRPGIFSNDMATVDAIGSAANLSRPNIRAVDLMSGAGLLERDLKKWVNPTLDIICLDFAGSQLRKIPLDISRDKIQADARHLPLEANSLDVVVSRLALKDLTADAQPGVLRSVYNALRPGGIFIIADMVSPVDIPGAKEWLNQQHAMKQEMAGRNPKIEGVCHIPTGDEWLSMLNAAGFYSVIFEDLYENFVYTRSWVESGQVTEDQLVVLDEFILRAPEHIRSAFYVSTKPTKRHPKDTFPVQSYEKGVHLMYPFDIIKAVKNELPSEFNGFIPLPLNAMMKLNHMSGSLALAISDQRVWIYNLSDINKIDQDKIWPDWDEFENESPAELYTFGTDNQSVELLSQKLKARTGADKVYNRIIGPVKVGTCNFKIEQIGNVLTITFGENYFLKNSIAIQTSVKQTENARNWDRSTAQLELNDLRKLYKKRMIQYL